MRAILIRLALALSACLAVGQGEATREQLTVRTLTGVYTGLVNTDYPNVREFRQIPYAQPPTGQRRWLPPKALTPSGQHHYSYRFPPVCPQFMKRNLTVWNSNITDFAPHPGKMSLISGTMLETSDEDCLHMAIWTPLDVNSTSKLPVAIFLPGGSFVNGGVTIDYQMPAPLVAQHNDIIVATVGYRVNIFGFPKAAGLDDQNLGILDQRMAVEWLHANVGAFGGDGDRMILWGHSAGAVAADLHNYAFWDNPIVKGYYLMSGTAAVGAPNEDPTFTNFTFVAKGVGCDFPDDPAAELACMRAVPAAQIENFLGQYQEQGAKPRLNFQCVRDDKVYFGNYTPRAEKGFISRLPALISTTANEDSSLYEYPLRNISAGPWQAGVDKETLATFVCPASNSTEWRTRLGLTTYRYQFAATVKAITPLAWMGAYHAADVPMVFGTFRRRTGWGDFEERLSRRMQEYVHAFIVDPENGIRKLGWLPHAAPVREGSNMMRFGLGDKVETNVSSIVVDGKCVGMGNYEAFPT
jgi:carboxylesterase type B